MIFLQAKPASQLNGYIHQYWYLATDDAREFGNLKQMMFPIDFSGLSFYFSSQPLIEHYKNGISKYTPALYTGLITSPGSITFEPGKPIEGFVVAFLPHGFADLFDYDASATTDLLPDFFTMFEQEGKDLYSRIEAVADFEEKIKIADAFITKRLPLVDQTAPMIAAIKKIVNSNGLIDMEQLASEVNMSWSSLERNFKKRVGVSPKMYARFKRFHYALELLNVPQPASWTDIAHRCGYYDQAHFIREFKSFTGQNPTSFSVQDYPLFYRFIIEKS